MHPVRNMLKNVRFYLLAMCGCLCTGLLAQQVGAQASIAGSFNWGGPTVANPAWTGWSGAVRSDLATRRWGCQPGWGACLGGTELRLILERQRRFEVLRNEPAADQAPVAGGLWRVPPFGYLPPPTPEDQIVPAYRDRSVLRQEFQDSGKLLD